ncbi:MAG: metal-dependent hydrolase [Halohasta sp.]
MNKRGHVMNAVLLSIGLGAVLQPTWDLATAEMILKLSVPVTLGALMPDVDTAFGKHRKTFHNLPMLAVFAAWPLYFGNLQYVWIGVATHYILDVVGSTRGIALWYPLLSQEYNLPVGIPVSSSKSDLVTVLVTGVEIAAFAGILYYVWPQALVYGEQAATMLP